MKYDILTRDFFPYRKVSPVRTLLYVSAQLSGAISGTATVLGFYGRGRGAAVRAASLADLGPEFLLAFLAALVFFNAVTYSSPLHAAVIIGIIPFLKHYF
jgi:hypothetical protein